MILKKELNTISVVREEASTKFGSTLGVQRMDLGSHQYASSCSLSPASPLSQETCQRRARWGQYLVETLRDTNTEKEGKEEGGNRRE